MKNIAIFFGGTGVERDVSVITGVLTLNSVDKTKFNPVPIYISGKGEWYTGECLNDIDEYKSLDITKLTRVAIIGGSNVLYKIKGKKITPLFALSAVINCLHGERGEDGSLAGLLNLSGIPLASPPLMPSAVAMDKSATKVFLKGLGVKTLPCITVKNSENVDLTTAKLNFPVIVKPACLGSSIGITRANDERKLKLAVAHALRYGERAVIEKCLENFIEINCACYRDSENKIVTSECERPFAKSDILSFEDKYKSGERQFPADIPKVLSDKIKTTTEKVYSALGCEGIIRIDYMIVGETIYLNEINTVPGSLAYYLFSDTLKGYTEILTDLIKSAEKSFAARSTVSVRYNSGVLNVSGAKGGKRQSGISKNI